MLAVVVGTGNHLFADAAIGIACALGGWWAARRLHGAVPRGVVTAGPLRVGATSSGVCIAVMTIAWALFGRLA